MPLDEVLFWLIISAICLLLLRARGTGDFDLDVSPEARWENLRGRR